MHRIRVFIARVFSVLAAMALVGLAAPGLAAAAGPQTPYGQAKIINTDRIVGFPQGTMQSRPASQNGPVVTPVSETVALGGTASFSTSGSGFAVFWYYLTPTSGSSWTNLTNGTQSDGSTVTGASTTTLRITNVQADENNNEYEASFVGLSGSTTTNAATLKVTGAPPTGTAPQITANGNPSSESVVVGATIPPFSASATGTPTPTVQWQVLTAPTANWANISAATSTTYTVPGPATLAENGYEYRAVFSNSVPPSATTTAATLTVTSSSPPPSLATSTNWSGYADTGATFSAVSASWIVPTISCTQGENAYSSQWIGIDGDTSSTVEQDGTEADCITTTTGGFTIFGVTYGGASVTSPSYDAWFEMFGDSSVNQGYEEELSPSTNPVSPGDSMSASVSVAGTKWTLTIADTSSSHTGWTFSTSITFSGAAQSSAEWIVERPEICSNSCSLTALPDFGSVTISNATATTTGGSSGPISSYSDTAIEMVNGSDVLAVPGPLNGGNAFTDTWKATS